MKRIKWDKKKVRVCEQILREHNDLNEALDEISKSIRHHVTEATLRYIFQKHGLQTPRSCLMASPVEKFEKKKEESSKDRQIKSLVESVREYRARQEFLDGMAAHKAPVEIFSRPDPDKREMCAVVLASDWHVEEIVTPESVAFRNEYNLEIAEQRIKRFFDAIVWNIEHHRASGRVKIDDMILWLGGDLISGYIHEELVESNELSPTETILWLLPKLRAGIEYLLKELDLATLTIPCSFGNHGRTTAKPRISTAYSNSFEWLMFHQLASYFKDDERVHFEITPSAHQYVTVYGQTLHFHHGDDVRYQGGVGGLGVPLLKAIPQWDLVRKADYHMIGHHHQLLDYGRAVVNGSLIGYGPYSQRIRATFEEPAQMMFFLDSERGKTLVTPLWVAK